MSLITSPGNSYTLSLSGLSQRSTSTPKPGQPLPQRSLESSEIDLDAYRQKTLAKALLLGDNRNEDFKIFRRSPKSCKETQTFCDGPELSPIKKEDSMMESSERAFRKLMNDAMYVQRQEFKDKMLHRQQQIEQMGKALKEERQRHREMSARDIQARSLQQEEFILQRLRNDEMLSRTRQKEMSDAYKVHKERARALTQMISNAEQKQKEAEDEERRKLAERKQRLDDIHKCQVDYRTKYQKISDVLKSCKDRQALTTALSSYVAKIKSLDEAMEQLLQQCKAGEISDLDLQTGANFVRQIEDISNFAESEAGKINAQCTKKEEEAKRIAEEAARKKTEQEHAAREIASIANTDSVPVLSDVVTKDAAKEYMALQKFHEEFQATYADLLKDEKMKKFRFDCQKAVNIPVNTISAVHSSHMLDKVNKLSRLLAGQNVEVSQGHFSAASHPQGIAFCKNLMAKKFVDQGSTVISSKPEAAFAFAAVAVALWVDYPDFGQLLLAHFHKACPYLVPIFLPQLEGQSDQDYYKSLGYNYSDSGEVEKQDKFLKRMSGIMRLYAAILISPLRRGQNKSHPHGLKQGWRWLACILNSEPQPDICPSLLFDFLEVAGNAMYTRYGVQFQKLFDLICKEYFPRIQKVTPSESKGPVTRLENFLQTVIKQGRIPPPEGQLPVNFW